MYLTPYIRFAMHHVWLDTYYLERSIWDHEFIFIEKGSLKFVFENKEYIAHENDCVIIPPNVEHKIMYNGEVCYQPHFHFDPYYKKDREKITVSLITYAQMSEKQKTYFDVNFFKENHIDIPYILPLKEPLKIKNLIYQIIDEYTYKNKYSNIKLEGLACSIISQILEENDLSLSEKKSRKEKQLTDIVSFMNESVDKNITLDDIVNKFNISKWSLIQLFNKTFNSTPLVYYNNLRYIRAKELLSFSIISIKEISNKMNFNDPQTFSRWFKTVNGNYPSIYRKIDK